MGKLKKAKVVEMAPVLEEVGRVATYQQDTPQDKQLDSGKITNKKHFTI